MIVGVRFMGNHAGETTDTGPRPSGRATRGPSDGDDRAVSHVVGVLLMIAITVLLFSVIGVMAFTFDAPPEKAPRVATQGSFHLDSNGGGPPTVALTHQSGEIVDVSNVKVHITTDAGTVVKDVPTTGALSDGQWSSGETLEVPVQTDDVCNGGDEADIRLVYHGEERTTTMAVKEVPLQASEFEISNGQTVPEHEYEARVEVVYTGLTFGRGGPDIPEHVTVRVDGTPVHTFNNVNDGDVETHELNPQDPGASISVKVKAEDYYYRGYYYPRTTRTSTADHGEEVRVLRDGDDAPDVEGLGNQRDVATTLRPYMTDEEITLDDNQAIYLFEMGHGDEDEDSFDLQDTVVLVTFTSAAGTPETVERGGETRIVCPG